MQVGGEERCENVDMKIRKDKIEGKKGWERLNSRERGEKEEN